ncbi:helix-turn-helix domain-containing protein [Pseudomonas sp. NA-150]|uniref:helix-turn-helix domain-containing protein n=1 Tax=Pseudomonas sp. NA-150 TaxID=3367525 RepID=UPI0037C9F844
MNAVLERLLSIYGLETDSDLARKLDVNRQTLGSWRSRNSIPYSLCIKVCEAESISLNWFFAGEGPMRSDQQPMAGAGGPALSDWEASAIGHMRALTDEDRRAVLNVIEEKKRSRELERRVEELSAALYKKKRQV